MVILNLKKSLSIIATFSGVAIGTMHIINKICTYIATADNLLDKSTYEFYEWRFGKIAYTKSGNGAPLLLIHDLHVCSSSHEWKKVVEEFSKTNTVYTIDLLGCGCSDHPVLTYTNFLYVQLISDFIKHIIGEKTDVISAGDSSPFVLMACANDNTLINRVAIINPQNLISLAKIPTKRTKLIKHIIYTPIIGTFIYNIKFNKRTISEKYASSYFYDQNNISEKDILTCFEAAHKEKSHSKFLYASQKSRFTNANVICCLNKLNNSIFIIVGNANPENMLAAAQYQNQLPSIEIVGINKTKRLPHIERPDTFVEQIRILFSEEE